MQRFLPVFVALSLITAPGVAMAIVFDLPHLTFPEPKPETPPTGCYQSINSKHTPVCLPKG
jgi:hypothetical protein